MFGDNLKRIRKEHKLTQSELGNLVGVTGAYIQQLEKGTKTNPSLEVIIKICDALYVLPWEISSGDEEMSKALANYYTNMETKENRRKLLKESVKSEISSKNAMVELIKYCGFNITLGYDSEGDLEGACISFNKNEFNLDKKDFEILFKNICNSVKTNVLASQYYKDITEHLADSFIEDRKK